MKNYILKSKYIINNIYTLSSNIIPALIGVVTTPVIIKDLGYERFGILSIALVLLGYLNFLDFGIGRAVTKYFSSKAESREQNSVLWSAIIFQASVGLLVSIISMFVLEKIVRNVFIIDQKLIRDAVISFNLMLFALPFVFVANSCRGALEGISKFNITSILKITFSTINYAAPLAVILLGGGLVEIIGVLFVFRIVSAMLHMILSMKVIKHFKLLPEFSPAKVKELLKFGGWVSLSSILSPLLSYIDRFYISGVLGVSVVGLYTAPQDALSKALLLPMSFAAVLFPSYAKYFSNAQKEKYHELVEKIFLVTFALMSIFFVVMYYYSYNVLELWINKDFAEKTFQIAQVLTIGITLNSLSYVFFSVLHGAGYPRTVFIIQIIESVVYLIVLFFAIPKNSLVWVSIAWSFRHAIDLLMLFYMSYKKGLIHLNSKYYNVFLIFFLIVVIAVLGNNLIPNVIVTNICLLITVMFLSTHLYKIIKDNGSLLFKH